MAAKYDLVVLGAGPAGEKGAAQAAYFGKRVAVVDPSPRPGGIAVSTAGIPTKTLREGAMYLWGLGQSAIGVRPASAQDSWRLLMARKLEVSELMTKAVERNLVRHGIERIRGRARFLPGRRVEVEKLGGERGRDSRPTLYCSPRARDLVICPVFPWTTPTCTTRRASSRSRGRRSRSSSSAVVL